LSPDGRHGRQRGGDREPCVRTRDRFRSPGRMSVFIVLAMIVVVIGIAAFDRRDVRE
jgi:hypothetical protein